MSHWTMGVQPVQSISRAESKPTVGLFAGANMNSVLWVMFCSMQTCFVVPAEAIKLFSANEYRTVRALFVRAVSVIGLCLGANYGMITDDMVQLPFARLCRNERWPGLLCVSRVPLALTRPGSRPNFRDRWVIVSTDVLVGVLLFDRNR